MCKTVGTGTHGRNYCNIHFEQVATYIMKIHKHGTYYEKSVSYQWSPRVLAITRSGGLLPVILSYYSMENMLPEMRTRVVMLINPKQSLMVNPKRINNFTFQLAIQLDSIFLSGIWVYSPIMTCITKEYNFEFLIQSYIHRYQIFFRNCTFTSFCFIF